MQHNGRQVFRLQLAGKAVYFYIAKALERKVRLKRFFTVTI
jgi:hypothetical protein